MTITGPDARSAAPGQAVVDAAMLVLERMGLTPADLLAVPAARPAAPTFAGYIPVVAALVSDGCRRAYGSYRNRVTEQWGSRRIDEPTPSEIRQLVQHVRAGVVPRRNSRRGGALALRPADLDPEQCLILLREKGETVRCQPVSPTLMAALLGHAAERHAPPDGHLLRYRTGRPITSRRYDHLWDRLGRYLPWVRAQQISMHWIRHTTLTWVERNFGYAVAKAYAGHTDGAEAGATSTYVRASLSEVAAALAALTGEPHPLATGEGW